MGILSTKTLSAGQNDNGRRIDRILRKALPDHSLSLIHRLLRQGKVLVNEKTVNADQRILAGDIIQIQSVNNVNCRVNENLKKITVPLPEILWNDLGLLVFNKPSGLSAHGPNSLDTMVKAYFSDSLSPSLSFKPGPLHRLDRQTSGIITFSQSLEGAQFFSKLMRERKISKTYLAIVEGIISKEIVWEDELSRNKKRKKTYITDSTGIHALMTVKPLAHGNDCTLIEAGLITGRTHQIRAQSAAHGFVLLGDKKYGSVQPGGYFLHAWKIEFDKGKGPVIAQPPKLFLSQIDFLFGKNITVK